MESKYCPYVPRLKNCFSFSKVSKNAPFSYPSLLVGGCLMAKVSFSVELPCVSLKWRMTVTMLPGSPKISSVVTTWTTSQLDLMKRKNFWHKFRLFFIFAVGSMVYTSNSSGFLDRLYLEEWLLEVWLLLDWWLRYILGFFLRTWKEDESKGVPLSFDLQVSKKKGFFIIGFGKMVGSTFT